MVWSAIACNPGATTSPSSSRSTVATRPCVYLPSKPLSDARSTNAFLGKVRETLDVFFECFVPLRDSYQEFRASVDVRKNAAEDAQDRSVATAKTPKDLAACMLDWSNRTRVEADL